MGRGFLAGTFMGAIVSAVTLFVSSQVLERQTLSFPKPSASAVEVPAGTEFDQARPETDPALPQAETRPGSEVALEAPLPSDAPDAPPTLDTTALAVPTPEVEAPDTLETVTVEGDAPVAPAGESQAAVGDVSELRTPDAPAAAPDAETDTAIVSAPVEDAAPDALGDDTAPEAETNIAALPVPGAGDEASEGSETAPAIASDVTAPSAPEAPEISSEPSLPQSGESEPSVTVIEIIGDEEATAPTSPESAPLIEIIEPNAESDAPQENAEEELPSFLRPVEILENAGEVETDRLPQVSALGQEDDTARVAPATEPEAEVTPEPESAEEDARVATLPTIRRPGAETEPTQESANETAEATQEPVEGEEIDPNLPALLKYASAFENPEGAPLLSIVLVNTGRTLDAAQLEELPDFVAFGIEAGAAGAAQTAQAYRDAGREVVMIPSLPKGATPQDVEQALRVNFETITEAVAVMDVSGASFQADRAAVSQVVDVIATSGHGLITFPRGLNTAHQRATRAGVSTGLIFRELDGAGEDGAEIQRTLDRAAFRARQDEAVILVGTTESTTLIALLEWVLGNRADSVTLAPISAALAGGG